jgi:hypothetical protein
MTETPVGRGSWVHRGPHAMRGKTGSGRGDRHSLAYGKAVLTAPDGR